jgi:hypothetical protein
LAENTINSTKKILIFKSLDKNPQKSQIAALFKDFLRLFRPGSGQSDLMFKILNKRRRALENPK